MILPPSPIFENYSDWRKDFRMPSKTETQRKFMGADLARKRAGKKTKTGMSEKQLRDFAKKKE